MARKMKVRTRTQDGMVEVLVLVNHPMETGLRKDKKTKKVIPAHWIQTMILMHNGKLAAEANLGIAVSEDPLLGFRLPKAKNGDKIQITWKDNKGESGKISAVVDA
ncbi:MAG: thiosulfate oxidation carrier complex protein SoxZ [Acidiferrobacterales bacterium]